MTDITIDSAIVALAKLRNLEVSNRVDHTGHVDAEGFPCGGGRTWQNRWGRDVAVILDEAGVPDAG